MGDLAFTSRVSSDDRESAMTDRLTAAVLANPSGSVAHGQAARKS
jgi:hypothetical protein